MNEAKIRDKIAANLSILESGLQLIKTEYYLPNAHGTRGFVDILAKDKQGSFVIIEIKKSNKSAREAIHEVLKYTEGLKENKSLKDDEIRSIIVSSEWNELLVPFSSFVSKVDFELLGYQIDISTCTDVFTTKKIVPLVIRNERLLSDLHMYYLYTSKESLSKGISSIIQCYEKKGVNNYLLVKLRNNKDSDFMVYTTSQCLSEDEYLKKIDLDQESYEDFDEDYLNQLSGIDKTNYLHGLVILDSQPWPYSEYVNVGSPAKFGSDILETGWEVLDIIKGGALNENELLDDELIIDELKGYEGKNRQILKRSIHSLHSLKKLTSEVERCLEHNDIWLSGATKALADIQHKIQKYESFSVDIYIFNPSNTIQTINLFIQSAIHGEDPNQWIPRYFIDLSCGGTIYKYYGCLVESNSSVINSTLQEVFENFYGGSATNYLLSHIWGGYEPRDSEISSTYGLEYNNYFVELDELSNQRQTYHYNGFSYVPSDSVHPYQGIHNFFKSRSKFCHEVVDFYNTHVADGVFYS
ncbi:endonuclease NucS domain-containing protein [Pseudoalteromonas rhizosphaerae]|uniref:endonuclease NucS domain-containing protein n=1 Tax=Pseudoalteromonas rhizosphaerae TaxID=2518973 RepID=UPI003704A0E6